MNNFEFLAGSTCMSHMATLACQLLGRGSPKAAATEQLLHSQATLTDFGNDQHKVAEALLLEQTLMRLGVGSRSLRCAGPAGWNPRCSNQSAVRVVSSSRRCVPAATASRSAATRSHLGSVNARSAAEGARWDCKDVTPSKATMCRVLPLL